MGINIYAIAALIAGISNTLFGFFVYIKNKKESFNQLFALLSIGFSIWTISYFIWLLQTEIEAALFWSRLLNLGATLIPPFYLHWILTFLNITKKRRWLIYFAYLVTVVFVIFSFSPHYIKNVEQVRDFSFWPQAGPIYTIFLFISYIGFVGYAFLELIRYYTKTRGETKIQAKYLITATIIGFGGGATNFPLMYGIPLIAPYGMFLVIFHPFFFSYAIFKHHLFDLRVIATELLTLTIWTFLLVKTLLSETLQDLLINSGLLIAVIFSGFLLVRSVLKEVKQREKLEVLTNEVKKAYEVEKHARQELQRLDKAKTQFIMATQHHLRTPLTSMRGYLDLIFGGTYGKVPARLKKTLQKFQASTSRLIRTVPILKEIIEELKFEAGSKKLYLRLEKPDGEIPAIKADPEKLKVALFNILDNAVKYTRKGGITIKCKKPDDKLRIIIKDTGIGIPKEELRTLFTRIFERGEEAREVFTTGRGIGLYISFQIIKAHNGKIWAESEGRNKGSTFYVELPM